MGEEAMNALRALAELPIDDLAGIDDDDSVIYMVGKYTLTVGHVRDARVALKSRMDQSERCKELEKEVEIWRQRAEHWMHVADQEATKSQNEWLDLVRRLRRRLKITIAPLRF